MITARLHCIINHVNGSIAADIGTDHAYVPIRLIDEKRVEKVIASDVKKGPVESALRTVKKYNMDSKIDIRLGAGLSVLKENEADIIIIAGMGGILISEILEAGKSTAENAELILQPMNCQYELRKYLIKNGYTITGEDIAIEGFKVYNLLTVRKGIQQPFSKDIYYHLPPCLYGHKHFNELYKKKKREFTKVIKGLENSKQTDTEKLKQYKDWLKELERIEI